VRVTHLSPKPLWDFWEGFWGLWGEIGVQFWWLRSQKQAYMSEKNIESRVLDLQFLDPGGSRGPIHLIWPSKINIWPHKSSTSIPPKWTWFGYPPWGKPPNPDNFLNLGFDIANFVFYMVRAFQNSFYFENELFFLFQNLGSNFIPEMATNSLA